MTQTLGLWVGLLAVLGLAVFLLAAVSSLRQRRRGLIGIGSGFILLAAIVAVLGLTLVEHPRSSPIGIADSATADPATAVKQCVTAVTFTKPARDQPPVPPKSDVNLSGSVDCLMPGHTLWILSKPFDADTDYFMVQNVAVIDRNGDWHAIDRGVGDVNDHGQGFTYIGIDASPECASKLKEIATTLPRRVGRSIPAPCVVVTGETEVHFS